MADDALSEDDTADAVDTSKHGRRAVKLLKKVLPKVRQNELKLMLTSLKPEADVSGSKEDLVLALLQGILPGYPVDDDESDE